MVGFCRETQEESVEISIDQSVIWLVVAELMFLVPLTIPAS
jgi:hypothetical protein